MTTTGSANTPLAFEGATRAIKLAARYSREVWENGFKPYRNRKWMKKLEPCNNCKLFRYCEGGGMHLRREDGALMVCHHNKLRADVE